MKDNKVKEEYTEEEQLMIEYYSKPEVQKRQLEIANIKDTGAEIPD